MTDARDARLEEALRGAAPAPDGFVDAVMSRVRAAEPPRRPGRVIPLSLRVAAAAAAVLLVAIASRSPSDRPPSPSPATSFATAVRPRAPADLARRARLFLAQVDRAPDSVLALDLEASGLDRVDPDGRDVASLSPRDRRLVRGVALAARAARNGAPIRAAALRGLLR